MIPTIIPLLSRTRKKVSRYAKPFAKAYKKHSYVYTVLLLTLYLLVFQFSFVMSGDNWAEAFCEYVNGALTYRWDGFLQTGIAGYYNFLPKLASYPYALFGLPLGFIDHFFRIIVIIYTVLCLGFIAHGYNRTLIKSDALRVLAAFLMVLGLYHVSTFDVINVWYVGFVPIMLISLNSKKFQGEWQEIAYVAFATTVCLSKPSLILVPLVIYRMIRCREYLVGAIILFSIGFQMLLFFRSDYYEYWSTVFAGASVGLFDKMINTLLYPGLIIMKFFKVPALTFWIVPFICLLIAGLVFVVQRSKGYFVAGLLALTLLLASYTAIYPTDMAPIVSVKDTFDALYLDEMKLQRELMIVFVVALLITIAAEYLLRLRIVKKRPYVKRGVFILLILLIMIPYRSIDTQSSKLHVNIDPFRDSLTARTDICMPVPPTPSWKLRDYDGPVNGWYYESWVLGSCLNKNYEQTMDRSSFDDAIGKGRTFTVDVDGDIKSVLIPISNPTIKNPHEVVLINTKTKKEYTAPINAKSVNDPITYVAFDLSKEPSQDIYEYILQEKGSSSSKLATGIFKNDTLAYYAYSIKYDHDTRK